MTGRPEVVADCRRAVILRAWSGETRVSLSPVVSITAGYAVPVANRLVRGVFPQELELVGFRSVAVLQPSGEVVGLGEAVEPHHVEIGKAADDGAKEVGTLSESARHQKAPVAHAAEREPLG